MSDTVIRVENLGKRYKIGAGPNKYNTLRDTIAGAFTWPGRRFAKSLPADGRDNNGDRDDIIWALRNVSFDVKRGQLIGVIGRNGAGKSTLLKLLSRITEPTEGNVEIHGRVGALLEVGTGFHPELTGRENIYLNGAILGMKRVDIGRKFDEMVAFSGVEKFIDTPVKRYSSGMRVRLGFAIAAHHWPPEDRPMMSVRPSPLKSPVRMSPKPSDGFHTPRATASPEPSSLPRMPCQMPVSESPAISSRPSP